MSTFPSLPGSDNPGLGCASVPDLPGFLILPSDHYDHVKAGTRIFSEIAKTHTLFIRGGRVVELIATQHGPELSILRPSALQSRLDRYGLPTMVHFLNDGKLYLRTKRCPRQTAEVLLDSLEARELLPPIASITAAPVLIKHEEGLKVLGPGYHTEQGGILVAGGTDPPIVPISEAVKAIMGLYKDFIFQTPADFSRALAMLITPGLKLGGFLTTPTPIDIAEADQSQSGKTYRQTINRLVYQERGYLISRREGGVGSLDESISSALMSGRIFIVADNLRGKVNSQYLEAIVTSPESIPVRVPHRGEALVDARSVSFSITSNGIETTRDLGNRSSFVRIRKREPGYIWHPWPEGSLHAHVEVNQGYYLGCVHAVIRYWFEQGCPKTDETRHDMREWAGSLDWICRHIFETDPLMDGHQETQRRVSNPLQVWLRALCQAVDQNELLGKGLQTSELWEVSQNNGINLPNHGKDIEGSAAHQAVGRILSNCFNKEEGSSISIDGYNIQRSEPTKKDEKNRCNRKVKHYTFSRIAPCP